MDTETEKCHLVWSEERCLIRRIAQCDIRHVRLPLQYIIRRPATAQCTVIAFWVYKKIVDYIFDSDFEGRCCCCCFNGLLLMCILSLNHSCIRMSTKIKKHRVLCHCGRRLAFWIDLHSDDDDCENNACMLVCSDTRTFCTNSCLGPSTIPDGVKYKTIPNK